MENFEPEKIVRVRWWWDDRSGYYKVNKPGIDLMDAVSASDYDKLLALYRALQPQMTLVEKYGTVEIK